MAALEFSADRNDAFEALSIWLDRQQQLKHGSDFQLTDQALNLPVIIQFDEIDGLNRIDTWGLRVSLVHLSCIAQQILPTDRLVCITVPLTGDEPLELTGRIVYCSECLPGMYHAGVVLDWESLATENDMANKANTASKRACVGDRDAVKNSALSAFTNR